MRKHNEVLRIAGASLKKKFWLVILLILAVGCSILLQLAPAFLLQKIIDENFGNNILEGLWKLAILYGIATTGVHLLEFVKVLLTTLLGQNTLLDIRSSMERRLSKLSYKYYVDTPTGDIMSRLTTDVDAVNKLFSTGIIDVLTNLFKVIGLLVSLYLIAPQLILLEILMIPAIFLPANYFKKKLFILQKDVRIRISRIYTFIQEWFSGISTVKSYSAEKTGEQKFKDHLDGLLDTNLHISSYDSWFPCIMQVIRALFISLAIFFAAKNGTFLSLGLSVGTLAAIADLIGKLFSPIEALAQEFQTIQESVAGLSRINEFFHEPLEDRPSVSQTPDNSGIELKNLSFRYGDFRVLDHVDLSVRSAEKAVLVGRSGAGKTTLMNIVSGLYRPETGSVRICGMDPFTLPTKERRKLIGIVPQDPQLFDGTILENITLGDPDITEEQAKAAARLVGIHERIEAFENGYDTVIGEGSAGLSNGEVQLISIARAVAADPKVLLLDEPTSGMDANTEAIIFDAIRKSSKNRTILSISHRLSGILDAETVHIMANHGIVESGTPMELSEKDGWYKMYSLIEHAGWNVRSSADNGKN